MSSTSLVQASRSRVCHRSEFFALSHIAFSDTIACFEKLHFFLELTYVMYNYTSSFIQVQGCCFFFSGMGNVIALPYFVFAYLSIAILKRCMGNIHPLLFFFHAILLFLQGCLAKTYFIVLFRVSCLHFKYLALWKVFSKMILSVCVCVS